MEVKKFLLKILEETLAPIRERRAEYQKDIPAVYEMLRKGSEQAREKAAQTLDRVRKAMKIDYFNDAELIRQQQEAFRNM